MNNRIEIRPGRFVYIYRHWNHSSDTTLFMIHGLGGRGNQWREQLPVLKEKYSIIIPDLLGHDKSDKPKPDTSNPYSFKELNKDLQAIFKQYSTANNIIIGHSYGGALASALTINQDKVNKLILIAPTPCLPKMQIPFFFYLPLFALELLHPLLIKEFEKLAFSKSASSNLKEVEVQAAKANPMYMIKSIVNGMKDVPKIRAADLHSPTLIIISSEDKVVPPIITKQYYKHVPNHRFEVIDGGSHMVLLEDPKRINQIILNFLTHY
jgi:pimeloyl-ACP methyl ester carboxylesterase